MKRHLSWYIFLISIQAYAMQYHGKKRSSSPEVVRERTIQKDFLNLQRQADITTLPEVIEMRRRIRTGNPLGTQAQFNQLRADLNQLLSQSTLDVPKIRQKIDQLRSLNPNRWPFPRDYEVLLRQRITKRFPMPAEAPAATPTIMLTTAEQLEKIQQDFKELKEEFDLSTPAEQMTKVYSSPTLPGHNSN